MAGRGRGGGGHVRSGTRTAGVLNLHQIFVPGKVPDVLLWRIAGTDAQGAERRMGDIGGGHGELDEAVPGKRLGHLVERRQIDPADQIVRRVRSCGWAESLKFDHFCFKDSEDLPWPSLGRRGIRQTMDRWWCSYLADPDVTSMSVGSAVSTAPKNRSMPLILPTRRWLDLTDP